MRERAYRCEENQWRRDYLLFESCIFMLNNLNCFTETCRACSRSPPSSAGCQGTCLTKMHTLVDKMIIIWQREDAAAIYNPHRVATSVFLSVCLCVCVSVYDVVKDPLLEVVETSGQRAYGWYWCAMTHFFLLFPSVFMTFLRFSTFLGFWRQTSVSQPTVGNGGG